MPRLRVDRLARDGRARDGGPEMSTGRGMPSGSLVRMLPLCVWRTAPRGVACATRGPFCPISGVATHMITAKDIELRAGARLLLHGASFQIAPGDRIGLVGRNGAGKTTLARVLAGEAQPAAGTVRRSDAVGYLPQDPRTGDLDVLALDRVLSARRLDALRAQMREAEGQMSRASAGAGAEA